MTDPYDYDEVEAYDEQFNTMKEHDIAKQRKLEEMLRNQEPPGPYNEYED